MEEFLGLLSTLQVIDVIDIIFVAAIFYFLFVLLRRARAIAALRGLIGVLIISFVVFFAARLLNLSATVLIFRTFLLGLMLFFLIVFQGELKRALADLGQIRVFRHFLEPSGEYLNEIIEAVSTLSKRRIGCLLVIGRRNPLRVYADTGTPMDSAINADILRTIFSPYTPLHDGAVIIRGDRIVAAGCILPLSDNPELDRELGTRHRAALGIAEETDALVIAVSEETGTISLAMDGNLERGLEPDVLKLRLQELLEIAVKEEQQVA